MTENLRGMKGTLKASISIPKENIKNKMEMGSGENLRGKKGALH